MDGLLVGKFSGLLSIALLNTQFYKTKSSSALLLYPVSAYRTQVSIYTWIQNNALYRSATKNSEPLPGGCLILACLPCMMPQKFRKFHHSSNLLYAIPLSLCLEPAELLIIFQELEHILTLKKYQRCRQNTFGGDQYGYNEKGSSYNI